MPVVLSGPSPDPPPSVHQVEVRPSAVFELAWALFRIKRACQYGEPIDLGTGIDISANLGRRVAEFWEDGARFYDELIVVAQWSGTLFETDPSGLLRCFAEVLHTTSVHDLGLASERPDTRLAIEDRLRRLAADRRLCSAYVSLLNEVWGAIGPEWLASGLPSVVNACKVWRWQLDAGARVNDLLPGDHAVFQIGMSLLLEAALSKSEVVVTPCHFLGLGHILDLPGLLSIGVRTTVLDASNAYVRRGHEVARSIRVLGNATRSAIIALLLDRPADVAAIAAAVGVSTTTVRSHLRLLRTAGIVAVVPNVHPLQFRAVTESIDRTLNEVSARFHRVHGRATRLHSQRLTNGAGFTSIFEHAPIAIIQLDLRGRCLACNPESENMLGYKEAEMSQLRGTHLLADDADQDVFEVLDQAGTLRRRNDVRLRRKDGSVFWGSITVSVVCDEQGIAQFTYVMVEDLSDRRGAEDFVTGLPNRVLFVAQLDRLLALTRRTGDQLAVLMIDLDGFKQVNDTLGHDVGDGLLRQVGIRLVSTLRGSDTVARLGGDEFGVLVMGPSTVDSATALATKLRNALLEPFLMDGIPVRVGASVGIVLGSSPSATVSALMGRVDRAMYSAKRAGTGFQFAL
jgi:diguanylate cyclase (GGDEF)-like protein/PAS domain S-box-containing protein